jgi:spore germination cell wall hydrolase CwlJ-like protein
MITQKSLIGGLFFFLSLLISLGFGAETYIQNQQEKITKLQKENRRLQSANHSLSHNLATTKDSLNAALSRDVMWLSRVLYTETHKPLEMYYVAHVVKNRVQTCYRGECTYKEVVLDPYQFSAFNPNRSSRWHYMNLSDQTAGDLGAWIAAKQVALDVYMEDQDPTNGATYFFSQVSMPNHRFPHWASSRQQVSVPVVDEFRFRFYKRM